MKYSGLSDKEVISERKKHGTNDISKKNKNSFLKIFIESLGDPIIKILLIALAIKVVFLFKNFDWYETIGIVIAIFISTIISSLSEYGSESAFETLQSEFANINVKVIRNSKNITIPINDIVVNDIVTLETGDLVPADGTIINGCIDLDESSLNGESDSVKKQIGDKIFRGSIVLNEKCIMQVTSVGLNTMYGNIALELLDKGGDSPLKLRLTHLAKILSRIGYVGAFLVFFSYLFSVIVINNNFDISLIKNTITNYPLLANYFLYALTLSVTIIVVAVPEGLPMMITLVLSSNMKKLIKRKVLVRKLEGIETSGNINILFTDKTGTITSGKLHMVGFADCDGNIFKNDNDFINYDSYKKIVYKSIVVNNESKIDITGNVIGGNNTDKCMKSFIVGDDYRIVSASNFNSDKKYLKTVLFDKKRETYIKGSFETIIKYATYYIDKNGMKKKLNKEYIQNLINNFSSKSYRVIACAYSDIETFNEIDNLILIGFALIQDEIRENAILGLNRLESAHVQIVMITGDAKGTAVAIGKKIGLLKSKDDLILTHDDISKMSDDEIKDKLQYIRIIARAIPSDKSRMVVIAQKKNLVVGMTGDGVNDAPALKKSDVGFSMGSGLEVAKEASDIVILDNNINSIAESVWFGRTIFKSIRKFIVFQITINICAVLISIIGPFINVATPVTVVQMLWINMIMDTLAALAFSFEPTLKEYMEEYPKNKSTPIINKYMYSSIIISSIFSSIILILILKCPLIVNLVRFDINNKYLYTMFFAVFVFLGVFNALNARSERINIFANIKKNKVFIFIFMLISIVQLYLIYFGGNLFRSYGLNIKELLLVFILSILIIPIDILRKLILRKSKINRY